MNKIAAVYLGSKMGNSPIFAQTAYNLGKELTNNNIDVIYGGACVGCMGELAKGVIENNGKITGVFPIGFGGKQENVIAGIEVMHKGLSEMITVKDMQERKKVMEEKSNFCIILPGSFGTLDELFEYAVNLQLGFHKSPIYILNLNNYYTPLKQLINNMVDNGFIHSKEKCLITFFETLEELINYIK